MQTNNTPQLKDIMQGWCNSCNQYRHINLFMFNNKRLNICHDCIINIHCHPKHQDYTFQAIVKSIKRKPKI